MSRHTGESSITRNSEERAEFGCITTWENAAGQTLTLWRKGVST